MRPEFTFALVVFGASCASPPPHDAAKASSRFELTLECQEGEHLTDLETPAAPPPSPVRWFGQEDDTRRNAHLQVRTVEVCAIDQVTVKAILAAPGGSLSSRQLFALAQTRAHMARCLLRVMSFGDPYSESFDRPFIPPIAAEGKCAKDEALVTDLRSSAESLAARAYAARAREPDACTTPPTLPVILHEQAFLAFARGDLQRADSLFARIESTCPSLGHAPMAAVRRADVAYEAALAGKRGWEGVDEAYARVEETCSHAPATTSNIGAAENAPSEKITTDKLTYPVPCERIREYVRWKRPFALLSAHRSAEANEHLRLLFTEGRPRPSWLLTGWWCERLDEDVRRWGATEQAPCTTTNTPRFGIVQSAPTDPRF